MIRGVVALSYPLIVPAVLNVTGIGTVFNAAPVIADKLAERIRAALAGGRRRDEVALLSTIPRCRPRYWSIVLPRSSRRTSIEPARGGYGTSLELSTELRREIFAAVHCTIARLIERPS
jgi:hypothetical protein